MLDDVSPRTRPMAFSRSKRTAVLIHSASLSSNNRLTLVCDNSVSRQRPRSLGWAINSVRGVHNEKKKKKVTGTSRCLCVSALIREWTLLSIATKLLHGHKLLEKTIVRQELSA